MKVVLTQPNTKGQMVIPKQIRKKLNITSDSNLNIIVRDRGFYVYPVNTVIHELNLENIYGQILKKTKGAWSDDAEELSDNEKKKKIELTASRKRKKTW